MIKVLLSRIFSRIRSRNSCRIFSRIRNTKSTRTTTRIRSRIFSRTRSRIRSRIFSRTRSRIRSSRGIINSTTPRRSRTARRARLPQIITDSALQASRFPALQFFLTSFSACPASWDLFYPLSDFVNAINVRKKDAALQLREL